MRLVLGGGGSGGHVFPALAVASALRACLGAEFEALYVGTATGVEATLARDAGVPFRSVAARPLRGRNVLSKAVAVGSIVSGTLEARRILRAFRPDAVLLTGGYVSVPVGMAARRRRLPVVVFQPDVEAGWAVRVLARLATRVCVTSPRSLRWYRAGKAVATGYPLRPVFGDLDRPLARARFQLNGDPALLLTGAVQGARRLNDAVDAHLEALLEAAQILHVTGPQDAARMRARCAALPPALRHRYQVFEYLGDELPIAMAACDLAVSRAGASVMGEFPAAGLPSVLVPLPAAGGHQRRNAEVLADAGAAVILDDADVAQQFLPTVRALLHDPQRLAQMRERAVGLARPDAAQRIARVIWEVCR